MGEEQKQAYWDDVAESFDSEGRYRLWRRHSDHVNCGLLQQWLPARPIGRMLKTDLFDEATSGGLYPFLAERCERVCGIDISEQAVSAAARKYPDLETRRADLRDLPFESCSFDCVISNSTLDHFQQASDIHVAISELFRVIRPGGSFIVTMDNMQNPVVWLRNHAPGGWLQKTGVVPYFVGRSLTRSGLVEALRSAGFETLESTAIMHCPRLIAVARASAVQQRGDSGEQKRFLSRLRRWERLQHWPSRYFTGYFVAARARRPE